MSVSLFIDWPDGREEEILLSPQEQARLWGAVGIELGLRHFDGVFPILLKEGNITHVLTDFRMILAESESRGMGMEDRLRNVIIGLEKLQCEHGWKAMIS